MQSAISLTSKTHFFIQEKFLLENESQKPQNLKKIFRKSPASKN